MIDSNFSLKHIFGLKVRDLRLSKGLSFQEMSDKSGLSMSYLSEIEKGKKYPKGDKIMVLAAALEVSYDYLVSLQVSKKLEPVISLLQSDIFKEFPMETFGLDPQKIIELVSQDPEKINAFITSVINIARNYEMRGEHFYYAALRSYQEMHDNYFKELEEAAEAFRKSCGISNDQTIGYKQLENLLKSEFGIDVDRNALSAILPLRDLRSYYVKAEKRLLLNDGLTEAQESFLLGRELAFQYLKVKKRPEETPPQKIYGFDSILNNYKASYFSAALIMPEVQVVADIKAVAAQSKLDNEMLISLIQKYGATPELLMQRLTNILPQRFDIKNLFFLRFVGTDNFSRYDLTKELHLSRAHSPHANGLNEHYCRRWLAIRMIKQLRATSSIGANDEIITGAQISKYYGTDDEYFCLSLAFPNISNPVESISVTIGFYIESNLKKRIKFIGDPDIKSRIVNNTCERCAWAECEDRIAPPEQIEKTRQQEEIISAMEKLG